MNKESVIDALVEHELDQIGADDHSLSCILREGCVGYENMDNDTLSELYEKCFGESIEIVETANVKSRKRLGTADLDKLLHRVISWLINEADRDESIGVIEDVAGVTLYDDGLNDETVVVCDNAQNEYCGMFNEIIQFDSIAMCDKCGHKENEKAFHVLENGEWLGDLKCPRCGNTAVTVADPSL